MMKRASLFVAGLLGLSCSQAPEKPGTLVIVPQPDISSLDPFLAEKTSNARNTRVVGDLEQSRITRRVEVRQVRFFAIGARPHGSKLQQRERVAMAAHPFLAKQDWARGTETHKQSN